MKPHTLQHLSLKNLKSVCSTFLLAAAIISLVACSDNGSSSSSSGSGSSGGGSVSVSGGGVKGPLAGAVVTAFAIDFSAADFKGSVVGSGSTNGQAQIQNLALPFPLNPPYLIEITADADTIDITTGMTPVISTMRTVITQAMLDSGEQIYATPLTTMAVDIAIRDTSTVDASSFEAALSVAATQVKSTLGFGLDSTVDIFDTPPLIDNTTDTAEEQAATAAYRAAVEAVTAVAYELQKLSSGDTDTVLAELAKDLADGTIDGAVSGVSSAVYAVPALAVLSQDPATLIIPNTSILVANIEQALQTETAATGQTTDTTALDTIDVATQPASINTDLDADGALNAEDAFPEDPAEQLDTDGDHIGNNADSDDDNDGWADADDDFPLDSSAFLDPALDRDSDNVVNGSDNCPMTANTDQVDTDANGEGDACADDADGDGVADATDNCPLLANPDQLDTDADTEGDVCDNDDDGDAVLDADDLFPLDATESSDLDGDNIGDNSDPDRDGDGVDNMAEASAGTNPELWDTDADGYSDGVDLFPLDPAEALDSDSDGVGNNADNCPAAANADQANNDSDAQGDVCDSDDDNDGVNDGADAFPLDGTETVDTDSDGVGDNADNCPADANADQANNDSDTQGDVCDADDDNDGVLDVDESTLGTNPLNPDTDADGVNDGADAFPLDNTESADTDSDGVGDNADAFPLDGTETADTDSDGVGDNADAFPLDGTETADTDSDGVGDNADAFPLDNTESADTDSDGVGDNADNCPADANADQADNDSDTQGDVCDADDDNDSVLDASDNCQFTPNTDQTDANSNNIGDACEVDSDSDGVIDDLDNCPAAANADQADNDSDTQGDVCDADDDNDGVLDVDESTLGTDPLNPDTDADGVNDGADAFPLDGTETVDTDSDGVGDNADNCPADANADQADNDSDTQGDVCDADDDNDGVLDVNEPAKGTDPFNADTDSDTVGDATDNCPVTENTDQVDANTNGVGDACESPAPDMSGIYLQDYTATSGDEWDGAACQSVLGNSGSEFWRFEQNANALTVHHMNGDWSYSGNIQADGSFTFSGSDSMEGFSDSFSGSYNEVTGAFTGTWTGQDNTNSTPVCSATFNVSGSKPQPVSEQTVISGGGVVWFDTYSWWDGTADQFDFEYGVISAVLETQYAWDEPGQAWVDITAENVGTQRYLLADGSIESADDIVIIDGYAAGTETAILKLTSAGVPLSHEIIHVDLEEFNLEGKAMLDILGEDFAAGLAGSEVFTTGARAYQGTITNQVDAYGFWCDDDWDDWFATNLNCDNILALDWVETPAGSGNFDPVPATALSDLIVNSATETIDPTGSSGSMTPGIWIGNGYDTDSYDINAYLVSDDGSAGGSTGSGGTVHFYKVYWNTSTSSDTGITVDYSLVNRGAVEVLEWVAPASILELGEIDAEDAGRFLFVDTVSEAGGFGNIVRQGDKFQAGTVEQELLLNTTALDQFKAVFSYSVPVALPPEFVAASNNGINFTADSVINFGTSFGVAGSGILRTWETNTHEADDVYVFDATGNGGRWTHQEWLLADDSTAGPVSEAMTWLVNADGNLEITITSTGSLHQVALNSFNDTLRPDLLVVVDGAYDAALDGRPERLLTQAQYKADLIDKVDLVDTSTVAGNYHYSWDMNEQIHLNANGTVDNYFDNGSGLTLDGSGTWTVDAVNDFFTLDWCAPAAAGCGDEDIVALESIAADSGDIDGDTDTTENVYTFTGWWLVDSVTGLGSMYRDQLLIIQ